MGSLCSSNEQQSDSVSTERQTQKPDNSGAATQHAWVSNKDSKIVIIGAGPSGCHLASLLAKNGFKNITILEKSNRIGGKSQTYIDDAKFPHEMGTCFTSKLGGFYQVIYDLYDEYWPQVKQVALPDSDKQVINLKNSENKKDHKYFEYKPYYYGKAEKIATPEWLHWLPDTITGGAVLIAALNKYVDIHEEIFGKYEYSILPRVSSNSKYKKDVSMTIGNFLKKHELDAMKPLVILLFTMFGYGHMNDIPVYYMFWFLKGSIVKEMISFVNLVAPEPTTRFTSNGIEKIWPRIVNAHKDCVNVIFNCQINSCNRNLDEYNKNGKSDISITYSIKKQQKEDFDILVSKDKNKENDENKESKEETLECDVLFVSCGVDIALETFLNKDASDEEREIFGKLAKFTLTSAYIEFDTNDEIKERFLADNGLPEPIWREKGNMFKVRMLHKKLETLENDEFITNEMKQASKDKYYKNGRDRAVLLQFINKYGKNENEIQEIGNELKDTIINDLKLIGIKKDESKLDIKFFKAWQYCPYFDSEWIDKDYPWIIRNEMQGKYNNTYYIGSSVSFESVKDVVEYNLFLAKQIGLTV